MSEPLTVVLDTNVLEAAFRSRRGASFAVLSLVGTGCFEIAVSVPLVLEYEEVLLRNADERERMLAEAVRPRRGRASLADLVPDDLLRDSVAAASTLNDIDQLTARTLLSDLAMLG